MRPIDYRNETFRDIQTRLHSDRATVLEALQIHGPTTTRHLAEAMGCDILSVRPRVTELVQLGMAELVQPEADAPKREGVYRALTIPEAEALFAERQAAASDPQGTLDLAA
ncbi:MAG: hypothetical protein V4662_13795 [Verrucomicrobiota bacterium]